MSPRSQQGLRQSQSPLPQISEAGLYFWAQVSPLSVSRASLLFSDLVGS